MDPMPLWRSLNLRDNPFAAGSAKAHPFFGDVHGPTSALVGEAIRQHHPLIVFTGETGSGRTTVVQALLADPELAAIPTLLSAGDVTDFMGVLRRLLATVDAEGAAAVPSYHLGSRLLAVLDREPDLHLLLALDDADHIDPSVIEDAIRLAAVVNAHQPQVSLLLVGEPKLVKSVNSVLPNTLHAPTPTVIHLAPLSANGVAAYIANRLAAGGYEGALPFTVAAVARIADAARGRPAHVDRVCAACFDAAAPVKLPMHIGFVARVISALSGTAAARAEAIRHATPVAATAAEVAASGEHAGAPFAAGPSDADRDDALSATPGPAMERRDPIHGDELPPTPSDGAAARRPEERISFAVAAPSYGHGRLTTQLVPAVGGFADSLQLSPIAPTTPATMRRPLRSAALAGGSRRRWLLITLGLIAGGTGLWALDGAFDGSDRPAAVIDRPTASATAPVNSAVNAPINAPINAPGNAPGNNAPAPATASAPVTTPVATLAVPPIAPPVPPPAIDPPAAPKLTAAGDGASPAPLPQAVPQATLAQAQPPASDPPSPATGSPAPAEAAPTSVAPAPPPAAPAVATTTPPPPPAAGSAASPANPLEAAKLIARGENYLAQADIASAQLFFRLAADRGSGPAARAMAATVDPVALAARPIPGARANAAEAVQWYRRAVALGDGEAGAALARLSQLLREQAARGDAAAAAILKTIP